MQIPILLITYNRPDHLRRRLIELLENEKASLVIISIDYCSDLLTAENNLVINGFQLRHGNRIRVIHRKNNLGIAKHLPVAVSEVLSEFSYVIVIEDDIRIGHGAINHFVSASWLLDSKPEIFTIGGFGPTFWMGSNIRRNKWRESIYFSAWGWMTSKTKWQNYHADLSDEKINESLFEIRNYPKLTSRQKNTWSLRFRKIQKSPEFTWDIQMQYWTFRLGKKHLLPVMRILENQGFSDLRSANTSDERPRWMGKERTHQKQTTMGTSSSLFSKLYIFADSYTIGGDRQLVWIKKLFPRQKR